MLQVILSCQKHISKWVTKPYYLTSDQNLEAKFQHPNEEAILCAKESNS